ncbi:hypothetical protein ACFS3C_19165 [Azotobacter vinelandii]
MMDQAGMSGESAGNALRNVFQSGFKTDKVAKANKMLKKLGISLDFTDGKRRVRRTGEAVRPVAEAPEADHGKSAPPSSARYSATTRRTCRCSIP